eukprot:TRINITY_DN74545_c0_g1_i1.p1 TRINITY_DN74545_c0_g1~~TRINITY_DN74545_c0_g1_i1.p1  ORF type:complete len:688 (+),score=214.27 TRINITY_DN74545_c0_g1_i1:164-2227(+)
MPKVAWATAEEVYKHRDELLASLSEVRNEIAPTVNKAEKRLQEAIEAVRKQDADNATQAAADLKKLDKDSKAFAEQAAQNMYGKISPTLNSLKKGLGAADERITEEIGNLDAALRQELAATVEELCKNFEDELVSLKDTLTQTIEKTAATAKENLDTQRKELDAALQDARSFTEQQSTDAFNNAMGELRKAQQEQGESDRNRDENNSKDHANMTSRLDGHDAAMKQCYDDMEKFGIETKAKVLAEQDQLRLEAGTHFDQLDSEFEKLRNAVQEVENISTKRVDWVIRNISEKLRPKSPSNRDTGHKSWFSPKFNCAGCHALQLELQWYPAKGEDSLSEEAGDCAVFLWACKGTSITYKLFCGERFQTCEKVFKGRSPCGTKRLCFIKEQINKGDDTLRLSVEVLESHRQVEYAVEVPGLKDVPPPGDGVILFHRTINNRLVDQVKHQVDLMSSRLIRKIEWRVEHVSRLRQAFPVGSPICSAQFTAAGVENLQLVFYPSGYNGAQEGYCSLYVYGPAGAFMSCTLHVGPQKRDASHTFLTPGLFGCTNFCTFTQIMNSPDDSLLISIDIKEANKDFSADTTHPTATGHSPVKSTTKLMSRPGKVHAALEDMRVLPSIWTAAFQGSVAQLPDGYHPFEELKESKGTRAKGGGRPALDRSALDRSGLDRSAGSAAPALDRSASLPRLRV